jgi:hypothetical protein
VRAAQFREGSLIVADAVTQQSAAIGRSTVARMPQPAPGHHCVSRRASEFAMDRPAAIC